MAEFLINTDVVTDQPTVEVTLSPAKPLPLGRHQFRLIVVDNAGNKSIGDEVVVIVADQDNPTAILNAPGLVGFGRSFQLDGSKSFDVGGGKVVQYVWTYLGQPGAVVLPGPILPAPILSPIP
jgi:hypothetical protein